MIAQHVLRDAARPARGDLVQHGRVANEHPLPTGDAVRSGGRLVRGDDPCRAQPLADRTGRARHARAQAPEHVGDGALRDGQAEHLAREPRQALETDVMAGEGRSAQSGCRDRTVYPAPSRPAPRPGSADRIRRSGRRTTPPVSPRAGSAAARCDRSAGNAETRLIRSFHSACRHLPGRARSCPAPGSVAVSYLHATDPAGSTSCPPGSCPCTVRTRPSTVERASCSTSCAGGPPTPRVP